MIRNRQTNELYETDKSKAQSFLYNNFFGRIILKLLICPFISKIVGRYQDSRFSKRAIKKFIKKNNINMDEYEDVEFKSFNDFFTRKLIRSCRNEDFRENEFISPCDSKLSVYEINNELVFKVKNAYCSVETLLDNKELAKEYVGGYVLIFRLTVTDYHRYCYIDEGYQGKLNRIKGKLQTVNPIALGRYNFYHINQREYTVFESKNFGDLVYVSVGALMVGKIKNYYENYSAQKGEEMGTFKFGGSTVCVLVKKGQVEIDQDILEDSKNDIETMVKYAEVIGKKVK